MLKRATCSTDADVLCIGVGRIEWGGVCTLARVTFVFVYTLGDGGR